MRVARITVLLPAMEPLSSVLRMPGEKFHDCPGEEVVAIPGDHVPGTADIDEVDIREAGNELVGSLLGARTSARPIPARMTRATRPQRSREDPEGALGSDTGDSERECGYKRTLAPVNLTPCAGILYGIPMS